jgi:hypothetical protein
LNVLYIIEIRSRCILLVKCINELKRIVSQTPYILAKMFPTKLKATK